MADNTAALDTVLTTLFKEASGWLYDFMILNGNGANQSLGVRNSPALINITRQTAGSFVLLDAANMMAQMLPSSWKKAVFIAHPSVYPQLLTMTTSLNATPNNFLVWLNPMGTGNEGPAARDFPSILLGRPLYFTEKVPKLVSGSKGSVLLIDADKILFGDRMAIQIESSIYPYWETAQVGWRIMLRFDSQPEVNGPVILNSANDGSNYTVSPYVSLTD
jgi:HK97 family phage major capsid protein